MLQIFRNYQLPTSILLLFYSLIFYIALWLYPVAVSVSEQSTGLCHLIYKTTNGMGSVGAKLLFLALTWIQALLLNQAANNSRIAKHNTYIHGLCYLLVLYGLNASFILSPIIFANTFIILALYNLLQSYEKNISMIRIFNLGLWLGLAGLFYFSTVSLLIWAIFALIIIRGIDLREIFIVISGFFLPFIWITVFHYLNDNLALWWATSVQAQWGILLDFSVTPLFYLQLGILSLVLLWTLLNWQGLQFKTTLREQKYLQSLFLMPIVLGVSLFCQKSIQSEHIALWIIPISLFLSFNLQTIKRVAIAEFMHLFFLIASILVVYQIV